MTTSRGFVRHITGSIFFLTFGALALSAAPQLRLSTTAVGPLSVGVGANAAAQSINAFNLGDGSLNMSVSSSASWLSASIGASTNCPAGPVPTCLPISISLSTNNLAIGTYTESITLTDPNAIDSPQTITVTVQIVGPPSSVDLYVSPNNGASTTTSDTASITVSTTAAVQASVRTSDNGQWLSWTLYGNGSYPFSFPYQLRATAQVGQAPGNYTGTVVLSGSMNQSDNKSIAVTMHVTNSPILQFPSAPITFNVVQGGSPQTLNIGFNNLGLGSLAITGATSATTSGGGWLSALPANANTVAMTATPGSLSPGSYFGSITLLSNAANSSTTIPVRLNVAVQSNPLVAFGGVVDNAAFTAGKPVAAGSIAAIFGSQFSSAGAGYAGSVPLPTTLSNCQVLMNGAPVPLFYLDANQADIQVPFETPAGQATVQMACNGKPGNTVSVVVNTSAPRLFVFPGNPQAPDTSPYGLFINAADGTYSLPASVASSLNIPGAHPAKRGDVITIYALGLGPTSPSVPSNTAGPAAEPLARVSNVQIMFGGGFLGSSTVTPSYAGLAPYYVGLYQINVTIPFDAPTGNVPVYIEMPGVGSNYTDIAISQ
jgi:uncharacterized protein (TIGR03437 family)